MRKGPTRAHRVVRVALFVLGLYTAARLVRGAPVLMWPLTALWCWAAWRAVQPPVSPAHPAIEEAREQAPVEPVLALLYECLDGRPGVHLSTVLAHLQERGQGVGWTVSDLRARLEALGIPVRPKLKVNGVPTRGVHRDDLPPCLSPRESGVSPSLVDAP